MATHSSAPARAQAPHLTQTSHVNQTTRTATIMNALTRRAQAVLNDESIDTQTRAIIRYGLETHDPWLAKLVRCAERCEKVANSSAFSQPNHADADKPSDVAPNHSGPSHNGPSHDGPSQPTIEALAEIICRAGGESAGALFVLMGTLQHSTHPEALANSVKHFAFTRCGEFNLFGMVDAQLAVIEGELFAGSTPVS
jgi:hypothetical protein